MPDISKPTQKCCISTSSIFSDDCRNWIGIIQLSSSLQPTFLASILQHISI